VPKVYTTVSAWRAARDHARSTGRSIGFVPTMGALHAGHASLFAAARRGCGFVLASLFVNPTQFDDPEDFRKYPQTWDEDLALLDREGVDAVFAPGVEEMYPAPTGRRYTVEEHDFSRQLCGAHRPGHFTGVLTVVLKLLQIAGADRAYFGEKDYQQLQLVRGMAEAFFLETEIIGCPTVREPDGLALSSRNRRLSPADRRRAPGFHAALVEAGTAAEARSRLETQGFSVDYVEDQDGRRFGAVRLGDVRLIDNVAR
jgi:pantoate--beta-alanine ligase